MRDSRAYRCFAGLTAASLRREASQPLPRLGAPDRLTLTTSPRQVQSAQHEHRAADGLPGQGLAQGDDGDQAGDDRDEEEEEAGAAGIHARQNLPPGQVGERAAADAQGQQQRPRGGLRGDGQPLPGGDGQQKESTKAESLRGDLAAVWAPRR